ncbi:MAG: hypothetical protein BIFFINMI_02929 [Phycisphaerae bacterium]|nr:hypothetical protein [Phycisphaerae bacterium]
MASAFPVKNARKRRLLRLLFDNPDWSPRKAAARMQLGVWTLMQWIDKDKVFARYLRLIEERQTTSLEHRRLGAEPDADETSRDVVAIPPDRRKPKGPPVEALPEVPVPTDEEAEALLADTEDEDEV